MSPAVRPLVSIGKMLKTLHTNFLMSIIRLPRDCFMTGVSQLGFQEKRGAYDCSDPSSPFMGRHSGTGFFVPTGDKPLGYIFIVTAPISAAIRIRDARWACRACINTKRQPGNWPNACKIPANCLEQWNKVRPFGSPQLVDSWLSMRNLRPSIYYEHLQHVDLHGRCLLQVGDSFKLLPMKHLPVEDPYPLPLVLHLSPCAPR